MPRTLTDEQVLTLVEACEHLRDRFLLVLLAETGMRIGQALGLRHADFVSHRRELRIVPRRDNANGARAKTLDEHTIPISAGTGPAVHRLHVRRVRGVRLGLRVREPVRRALRAAVALPGGAPAGPQAALAHRDRVHLAHAPPHPGHRPAAPWGRRGRGGPAAHPPHLDDDLADLPPPRHRGPARRAEPLRRLGEEPIPIRTANVHTGAQAAAASSCGWPRPTATTSNTATPPTPGRPRNWECPQPAAVARSASPGSTRRGCGRRQTLGPATAGHRLRVQHDPRRTRTRSNTSPTSWPQYDPPVLQPSRSTGGCSNGIWPGWRRSGSPTPPRRCPVSCAALLEDNRRHGWVPAIPAEAVIYPDELVRSAPQPAPLHPRVRDEPARGRGQPRPAAPALPARWSC